MPPNDPPAAVDIPQLARSLKALLISELKLAGKDPSSIADDALLFGPATGGGLGLDSLDALQIAMLIEDHYGVRMPEGDEARPIFQSVATLAAFIAERKGASTG